MQYANGSVYEGQWRNGVREGFGRLIHVTGDMYEGDWRGDKANGYGVFSNLQGYQFEGQWRDDCQDGLECRMSNNCRLFNPSAKWAHDCCVPGETAVSI